MVTGTLAESSRASVREQVRGALDPIEGAYIELRSRGNQSMRLPLGASFDIGRGPLHGDLGESELVRWLAPPRATREQLGRFAPAEVVEESPPKRA